MSDPLYTLATFPCEGIGDVLLWKVEGHSLTDAIEETREISITTNNISVDVWSSVLTIRALPINNGISVGCTVISVIGQTISIKEKGATLTVLG